MKWQEKALQFLSKAEEGLRKGMDSRLELYRVKQADRRGRPVPQPIQEGRGHEQGRSITSPYRPVVNNLASAAAFLYTGDKPRQVGMAPGTVEARHQAILRGLVRTREGTPLPEVKVSIHHHPEFGTTLSGEDGSFDLVVNGGVRLCINYERKGYMPVCRPIDVPWQDYVWLPDVVLLQADTKVTTIDLTADEPIQVAQGQSDERHRRCPSGYPAHPSRHGCLDHGAQQPRKKSMKSLNVRVTEYTVSTRGPEAMPAPLPPTTGYTYAFELSADEVQGDGGVKVDGKDVLLSRPIYHYVKGFLGFPVGTIVPVGYYDNTKAHLGAIGERSGDQDYAPSGVTWRNWMWTARTKPLTPRRWIGWALPRPSSGNWPRCTDPARPSGGRPSPTSAPGTATGPSVPLQMPDPRSSRISPAIVLRIPATHLARTSKSRTRLWAKRSPWPARHSACTTTAVGCPDARSLVRCRFR